MLVVIVSWLSFFVDKNSAPARVSLGITTVLTMTTLIMGFGQGSLPAVSYVRALDWYLIVCYLLVFASFAEYAVVNYKNNVLQEFTSVGIRISPRYFNLNCCKWPLKLVKTTNYHKNGRPRAQIGLKKTKQKQVEHLWPVFGNASTVPITHQLVSGPNTQTFPAGVGFS